VPGPAPGEGRDGPLAASLPDHPVLAAVGPGHPGRGRGVVRWVGIAQKTGFGLVSPLPGIWPSRHPDTAITLPVGVKAYAAFAPRA